MTVEQRSSYAVSEQQSSLVQSQIQRMRLHENEMISAQTAAELESPSTARIYRRT